MNVDLVADRAWQAWAPPPELTVSEFADAELILATGPLQGSRWQTDFAPYQRGIMDAVHEAGVEFVIVMGSSQWGKTATAVNVVCYHIAHNPCSILVVEPTVDPMAKDFAKNRLDPTIRASPALAAVVDKKRAKDASNTTLQKTFRGGFLALAGANSAASLASRPVQLLVLDEVDRYPDELPGEGSTIDVAIKRTTTFRSRRRIFMASSPTEVGRPIHAWFQRGDQRRFFVPCPACEVFQTYNWQHVKFDRDDPRSARLACPSCGYLIDDAERVAVLQRGEWRATRQEVEGGEPRDPRVVSFHLWEAYSPLSSLAEIVSGFLRARTALKAGDRGPMHTWQNTTLGEPVEPDDGEGAEPHVLLSRREPYPPDVDAPAGAVCLTMGVDVQDDRLELLVVGWGEGEECWLVDREVLPGDTSQNEPWAALAQALEHEYRHASGIRIPVNATCIDSAGHRTTLVYDFVAKHAARRVHAIIGREGQRPIVDFSPSPKRTGAGQRKVSLYTVGTDAAKSLLTSRLLLTDGPGRVHIPVAPWADAELADQLTSERLVTTFSKGVRKTFWKKIRPRNEMLDCFVYATAAMKLLNPDFAAIARRLEVATTPTRTSPPAPGASKKQATWLGGRQQGSWLRRGR